MRRSIFCMVSISDYKPTCVPVSADLDRARIELRCVGYLRVHRDARAGSALSCSEDEIRMWHVDIRVKGRVKGELSPVN